MRTQGKGRVFYTAWGHDQRTWGNPGFQDLVERGIRWAVGQDPTPVTAAGAAAVSPFEQPFPVPEMTPKRDGRQAVRVRRRRQEDPELPARRGGQGEPLSKMQKPLDAGGVA